MTKEEKRAYEKHWYANGGKEKRDIANQRWEDKTIQAFKDYKAGLKCERCSETHPACLDFHHLDPAAKEGDVGRLARGWSLDRLKKEIAKCIVLCSNCHRKEHYNSPRSTDGGAVAL